MSTTHATDAAPVTINLYNSMFGEWLDAPGESAESCRVTRGPEGMADADAVVFHMPTLGSIDGLEKPSGQVWVAFSMESRVMCPPLDDLALMGRFDLTMTYERSSDVWFPYFGPETAVAIREPVRPRTASAPVVWLQSNPYDRCGRTAFAAELMRHVWIESFGAVLANHDEPVPPGHEPRLALYGRYKFTLAFENSFATDYVTEKLFEPLAAGSVPVYRGTDDINSLAPAPDCFINARDFGTPQELAAYLDHLDRHDDEYGQWHAWRTRPFSPAFEAHLDVLRDRPLCQLAAAVNDRRARAHPGSGTAEVPLVRAGTWDGGIRDGMGYEYPTFPSSLSGRDVVVDVGCHIGGFCEVAASRGATVIGFEANRENHALAVMNLAAFDAATVHCAAVWRSDLPEPTSLLFTPNADAENTGGGSVLFASERDHWSAIPAAGDTSGAAVLSSHRVQTVALDDVLVDAGHVRFLKIDAEGSEFPILLTSRRLDLVDAIAGEYHELTDRQLDVLDPSARVDGERYDATTLARTLEAAGFDVELSTGADPRLGFFAAHRR